MRPRLLVLCFALAGCHHHHPARSTGLSGLPGVPLQARQAVYSTLGGNTESVPYGVPHDAILDEATLYVQAESVCANVVLRQPMGFDEPLATLHMRCSADGKYKERAGPQQEQPPSERDYPFQGAPPMLRLRGAYGWADIPLGQATPNVFRVVERSFQVCCPFPASSVFRLTIDGQARYEEYVRTDFVWRLRWPVVRGEAGNPWPAAGAPVCSDHVLPIAVVDARRAPAAGLPGTDRAPAGRG